jgi:hypothetical protein
MRALAPAGREQSWPASWVSPPPHVAVVSAAGSAGIFTSTPSATTCLPFADSGKTTSPSFTLIRIVSPPAPATSILRRLGAPLLRLVLTIGRLRAGNRHQHRAQRKQESTHRPNT